MSNIVERLRRELENVNNEFGSQTADWPDAWRRVAEIKRYSNEQWQRAERAEAELAAARRDAERYRWLRDNHTEISTTHFAAHWKISPENLDAAIDAALAKKEN